MAEAAGLMRGSSEAACRPTRKFALDRFASAKRNGLFLPDRLPLPTWQRIGEQLHLIGDSSSWWLGDWLVYGQSRYPDRYKQAVAATSLDYQTLRNYAWVARRFSVSRRRDTLSFQHHAEVAMLPEREQDLWLDRAQLFRWPRCELRKHLRASRRALQADELDPEAELVLRITIPSERRHRWYEAAARLNESLEAWVALIIDQAASSVLASAEPRGCGPYDTEVADMSLG